MAQEGSAKTVSKISHMDVFCLPSMHLSNAAVRKKRIDVTAIPCIPKSREVLVHEPFQSDLLAFKDIANEEELWTWFDNVFVPAVYPDEKQTYRMENGTIATVGVSSIAGFNYVLGNPRIRTIRSNLKPRCKGILSVVPNKGFCVSKADDYRLTQTIERKFFSYEVKEAPKLFCPGINTGSVPFIISG